jgi:hypothetical protein
MFGEPHDAMGGHDRGYSARDLEGTSGASERPTPSQCRTDDRQQPAEIARRLIRSNMYLTLGSAESAGEPVGIAGLLRRGRTDRGALEPGVRAFSRGSERWEARQWTLEDVRAPV